MGRADTPRILSTPSHGKRVHPHCLSQERRRGRPPPRRCPPLAHDPPEDHGALRTGGCRVVEARRGAKETPMRAPLSQRFCVGNHHRCPRHQQRFPGQHLMSPLLLLLYRPFPPYFQHLSSRSTLQNHRRQVTIWINQSLWQLPLPRPINYAFVIYLYWTHFSALLGQLISTPLLLLLLAATELRVDHLTRSLQVKSTQTSNGNLYNHYRL